MSLITEKTDLDSLVAQVGETQANPTQYTIEDRLKTLNASILAINPITPPFFEITGVMSKDTSITPYSDNQAFATGSYNLWFNKPDTLVEITEMILVDDNQNSPLITPNLFLCEENSTLNWVQGIIPNLNTFDVAKLEIITGQIMVKIPGNSSNLNVLKTPIINQNIIMKTDSNGNLYFGITTSSVFTPKSLEEIQLTIKGRFV
jgi:hypothetical protein